MRISDCSSDVCSSDLGHDLAFALGRAVADELGVAGLFRDIEPDFVRRLFARSLPGGAGGGLLLGHGLVEAFAVDAEAARAQRVFRSEEHTSELQSLMRISYAVFCLKKKKTQSRNREQTVVYISL